MKGRIKGGGSEMVVGNTNKTKGLSVHYSNFLAVYYVINQ